MSFGRRLRSFREVLVPTETAECITFIEWTRLARYRGEPLFERVIKIPNERGKAGPMVAILERMGLKPGVPDYVLPVPIAPYHGLFLEAKRRSGGKASIEQLTWIDRLNRWGYYATICEGADELVGYARAYMQRAAPGEWSDVIGIGSKTARLRG